MNARELSRLIENDLATHKLVWHGRPIDQCLVEPVEITCLNSHASNQPERYWLVFEEGPNPGQGYKVVYDEELCEFGLAVAGEVEPIIIGIYGSFVETLHSM